MHSPTSRASSTNANTTLRHLRKKAYCQKKRKRGVARGVAKQAGQKGVANEGDIF